MSRLFPLLPSKTKAQGLGFPVLGFRVSGSRSCFSCVACCPSASPQNSKAKPKTFKSCSVGKTIPLPRRNQQSASNTVSEAKIPHPQASRAWLRSDPILSCSNHSLNTRSHITPSIAPQRSLKPETPKQKKKKRNPERKPYCTGKLTLKPSACSEARRRWDSNSVGPR